MVFAVWSLLFFKLNWGLIDEHLVGNTRAHDVDFEVSGPSILTIKIEVVVRMIILGLTAMCCVLSSEDLIYDLFGLWVDFRSKSGVLWNCFSESLFLCNQSFLSWRHLLFLLPNRGKCGVWRLLALGRLDCNDMILAHICRIWDHLLCIWRTFWEKLIAWVVLNPTDAVLLHLRRLKFTAFLLFLLPNVRLILVLNLLADLLRLWIELWLACKSLIFIKLLFWSFFVDFSLSPEHKVLLV